MAGKPYGSLVRSLMYAQAYTRYDVTYDISVLGRLQSNHGNSHWLATKKVLIYLQRTKEYQLVYMRDSKLELISYGESDFASYPNSLKLTYISKWGSIMTECETR